MDSNRSLYESFVISDKTMESLVRLLAPQARLKLFNELCEAVGGRIPERVGLAIGIRKTDVYRYFPKSKSKRGGHIPGPATTVKVIKALLKCGRCESVVKALEPAEYEMRKSYIEFFEWKKLLRKINVVYNPLSNSEMRKIKRSMW